MNYIELINWFWELDETWQFSCCETRLYFYLIKTANRLGWENNWTRSDAKVSSDVGVSPNSMKTARNRLVQARLIVVKQGGNGYRCKTRYQILTPKTPPNHEPNLIPNHEPNLAPINKLKQKTKTINNIPLNPPEEKLKVESGKSKKPKKEIVELNFPFSSEKFMNAWEQLINTPKWKKKIPYTLQLALNQLSKYEEEFAIKLIEAAAANDWQGVVFPQTDEQYSKWKSGRTAGKSNFANHDNTKSYELF